MTRRTTIPIFLFFLLLTFALSSFIQAQNRSDIAIARTFLPQKKRPEPGWKSLRNGNKGLLSKAASGLFLVYKSFFSSQDYRRCSFTISCSEFAMRSIRKHGFFAGLAMGLDRYSRCTGLHRDFYPHDHQRKRLIDPVR